MPKLYIHTNQLNTIQMTFYPKEGLITLHQSLNPPINQTTTEELKKDGYGEFITETEL